MPIPFAALLPLIGQGVNSIAQVFNNRSQKKFALDMYNRQRQDALADWQMTNSYNSPAEQMKRFKEAGLNPHLIYKQTNEAPAVRSASPGSYNPEAPQIDPSAIKDSLFYSVDLKAKTAQANNMEQAAKLTAQQMGLVAAQTLKTLTDVDQTKVGTEKLQFDLNQAKQKALFDVQQASLAVKKAETDIRATEQGMDLAQQRNEREKQKNIQDIAESIQRVAAMKLQMSKVPAEIAQLKELTEGQKLTNVLTGMEKELKEFEIQLNKNGITKSDPAYYKIISNLVDKLSKTPNRPKAKLIAIDKWPYFKIIENTPGATGKW